MIGAWAPELLAAERATAAKWGLEAAKVRQAETEAALQSTLETLEAEQKALESKQKAQSEAEQEVLALWGWVLGTEELNSQLCEQVTRQEEGLSILENTHLGTYPFYFWCLGFFSLARF